MCDTTNPSTQSIADYLAQLLKDRKQLAAFPNVFMHMERLLDEGRLNLHTVIIKSLLSIAVSCHRLRYKLDASSNAHDIKFILVFASPSYGPAMTVTRSCISKSEVKENVSAVPICGQHLLDCRHKRIGTMTAVERTQLNHIRADNILILEYILQFDLIEEIFVIKWGGQKRRIIGPELNLFVGPCYIPRVYWNVATSCRYRSRPPFSVIRDLYVKRRRRIS